MAWTTPTVRATLDLITASIYNTDIINNLQFLHDNLVGVTGSVASGGTVAAGTGFSVSKPAAGQYAITFSPTFAATPDISYAIIVDRTTTSSNANSITISSPSGSGVTFWTFDTISNANVDRAFHFSARPMS